MRALILVYSDDDWLDLDLIYINIKFGRICFCIGKVELINILETIVAYAFVLEKWNLLIFWKLLLPVNFNFVFAIN